MIDPAGIRKRGAERSAPRFSFGPSASDSQGIGRPGLRFMTTRPAEKTAIVLYSDPPQAGLEIQPSLAVAKNDALDLLSSCLHGAIESDAQPSDQVIAALRRIGRVGAELSAQRGRAATRAVACLTSAHRDRHAAHEGVVCARIRGGAPVGVRHPPRVVVQRVTLALELG
jgi:hypothetical protein